MRLLTIYTATAVLITSSAYAEIGAEPRMVEALEMIGTAAEIADNCPNISGRRLNQTAYLETIRETGVNLGYNPTVIDAYLDDPDERVRSRAVAKEQLADKGIIAEDGISHCTFGLKQIVDDTQLGQLIYAW